MEAFSESDYSDIAIGIIKNYENNVIEKKKKLNEKETILKYNNDYNTEADIHANHNNLIDHVKLLENDKSDDSSYDSLVDDFYNKAVTNYRENCKKKDNITNLSNGENDTNNLITDDKELKEMGGNKDPKKLYLKKKVIQRNTEILKKNHNKPLIPLLKNNNKKKKNDVIKGAKIKPVKHANEWDGNQNDLNKFKLSKEEVEQKRNSFKSRNLDKVKIEYQERLKKMREREKKIYSLGNSNPKENVKNDDTIENEKKAKKNKTQPIQELKKNGEKSKYAYKKSLTKYAKDIIARKKGNNQANPINCSTEKIKEEEIDENNDVITDSDIPSRHLNKYSFHKHSHIYNETDHINDGYFSSSVNFIRNNSFCNHVNKRKKKYKKRGDKNYSDYDEVYVYKYRRNNRKHNGYLSNISKEGSNMDLNYLSEIDWYDNRTDCSNSIDDRCDKNNCILESRHLRCRSEYPRKNKNYKKKLQRRNEIRNKDDHYFGKCMHKNKYKHTSNRSMHNCSEYGYMTESTDVSSFSNDTTINNFTKEVEKYTDPLCIDIDSFNTKTCNIDCYKIEITKPKEFDEKNIYPNEELKFWKKWLHDGNNSDVESYDLSEGSSSCTGDYDNHIFDSDYSEQIRKLNLDTIQNNNLLNLKKVKLETFNHIKKMINKIKNLNYNELKNGHNFTNSINIFSDPFKDNRNIPENSNIDYDKENENISQKNNKFYKYNNIKEGIERTGGTAPLMEYLFNDDADGDIKNYISSKSEVCEYYNKEDNSSLNESNKNIININNNLTSSDVVPFSFSYSNNKECSFVNNIYDHKDDERSYRNSSSEIIRGNKNSQVILASQNEDIPNSNEYITSSNNYKTLSINNSLDVDIQNSEKSSSKTADWGEIKSNNRITIKGKEKNQKYSTILKKTEIKNDNDYHTTSNKSKLSVPKIVMKNIANKTRNKVADKVGNSNRIGSSLNGENINKCSEKNKKSNTYNKREAKESSKYGNNGRADIISSKKKNNNVKSVNDKLKMINERKKKCESKIDSNIGNGKKKTEPSSNKEDRLISQKIMNTSINFDDVHNLSEDDNFIFEKYLNEESSHENGNLQDIINDQVMAFERKFL
ncbi:conserved Plasmodium protein, unknown function [Plasmodium yoelii]|uniref:Coiled-coil domain-containing protein 52 n=2 Tax=Plasmodium yoelii TaxID=5861 RepID=A0AAE9WN66_PLAYO|nr:conserved Plasmodium protein, unknown function [Plasmodium yoelii]WBY56860.1 hypothetical protein Py17XNL_000801866 [Plasmodium yoelii yoelii]CDU17668.1 conserved Plasmodium protein, unknown function [Plasmodium yoelii]VTZ77614.1 conserved Plasmodium protein, unknown function [Plasmodium yoelii]|eukprot:XP_022812011.1 conserved Plasmodium protein, unknown function [Plasmodium yoelii]